MKSLRTCLLLLMGFALSLGIGGNSLAADEAALPNGAMEPQSETSYFGKDWGIMFGAKAWMNEWDLPLEFRSDTKTHILEFESEPEFTYIPAVLVRYRNFFIGGSYLLETDYSFSKQQVDLVWIENDELHGSIRNYKVSGSRTEWDLNFGYFLTPNLAISIGYKNLDRDIVLINSYALDENYYSQSTYPLSANAPIIGISAAAPVGHRFSLYGNLAYGWLSGDACYKFYSDGEIKSNEMDLEGKYTFAELGLNYVLPLRQSFATAISFSAGYRFQRLDMKLENDGGWGNSGDQHDATAGFVFGVNASL